MPLNIEDIVFVYSGGLANANPDLSLGGDKSIVPITKKRLFNDLKSQQTVEGVTDYRCLYVANKAFKIPTESRTVYNVEAFFEHYTGTAIQIALGFIKRNEIQTLTVVNGLNVVEGTMSLIYEDHGDISIGNESVEYTINVLADTGGAYGDFGAWIVNLQNAIRSIPFLEDVEVTGASDSDNIVFTIEYKGSAGNRFHNLLRLAPGGNGLQSEPDIEVTSDILLDRFDKLSHGLVNGTPVYFTSLGTTTGITLNATYFVVNSFVNSFQIVDSGGLMVNLGGINSSVFLNRLSNKIQINFEKTVSGSPINYITDDIDFSTTDPSGLLFYNTNVVVGDLRPSDFFPIWIRRICPPEMPPRENDGFILRIKGDSVLNVLIE